MKSNFYNELHKNRKNLANNTSFLSDEKYNELIEIIAELKAGRKRKEQSTGTGQGFLKCICKTKCQNKKCICLKNNVLCTSKCHFSTTCCNK